MEVPYTIECYMYLNGIMLNYPAKKICGYSDIINLEDLAIFSNRD